MEIKAVSIRSLIFVFSLGVVSLMVSSCTTVQTADVGLRLRPELPVRPQEMAEQARWVAEWNAGPFNAKILPTNATAEDIARVTPMRIHLDGIKPTDPKDKHRGSTVTVVVTTQSSMVCTGTVNLSRYEYVVFGTWPWYFRWSDRSGYSMFWCPDNTAYFAVEIYKNHGIVTLTLAGEGMNTFGVTNRRWDFSF
jgi:hypothetical protein